MGGMQSEDTAPSRFAINTNEQRKRKLADCLTTPSPPLTDRISFLEPPVLDIKSFPSDLHFYKNVQVNQLRDYKCKFGVTATRLTPFFEILDKARASIDPQVATHLWILGQRFNRLYDNLTTLVEKSAITTHEWKDISRDLTKIGKHSFKALKPRFVEHCQELVTELGPDWLKIAEEIEVVLVAQPSPYHPSDILGALSDIPLGSLAEDSLTPPAVPVPLLHSYLEYSKHWVSAAQQSMTPVNVKNLVDSLYNQFWHGMERMRSEIKEGMCKRKNEVCQLQMQFDNLEAIRQEQAAQIADAQAVNRLLREKLEHAEKAYQETQTALLKAEEVYTELRLKVDTIGTGGSVGLLQSLFPTMKEPDTFNSDKANKLDDRLESMALWLYHRGVTQDEKKIETAMTYLRGTAKKVMQGYFDKINDQEPLGVYATFIEKLKKGFQQTDKKDCAIAEFNQLVAKKGTNAQNFGEFSVQFRTLAKQTGFFNAELLSKLYAHVPKPAADILITRGHEKWAKTWNEFINKVPNTINVDAVKGKKSSDKADGKQAKVRKMAMSFKEARCKGCCAKCGGKGHMQRECLNGKEGTSSSASSSKNTDTPGASSSKTSLSSSKGKEKDTGKSKFTKKSVRKMHGSDFNRFKELDSEDGSGSSSEEETPKPKKKKSSSDKKAQRVNRVVFSDNEDFLKGSKFPISPDSVEFVQTVLESRKVFSLPSKSSFSLPLTTDLGIVAVVSGNLGEKDTFLGFSYLKKHNPEIDWQRGELTYSRCPDTCHFTGCHAQIAEAELEKPMDEDFEFGAEEPWLE
ncbi:hypothetical protein CERSUDRAFT_71605 [Gelatoporia subvermispora B]|uniref:CCHC-type domain-containing protein n=1 Tax=Ceriporiopsis subvermispora (strain B) TaxID=914234 RepID=M2R578_CERS8|nr:hypothetical protein CERSUDRAFT_71605 [Gelatoporia subvermispora B]